MSAIDPLLESFCLRLFSHVREKTGCVLRPSIHAFFDGWRPELPSHSRAKRYVSAIRTLAPQLGFNVRRIPRLYELQLTLPAVCLPPDSRLLYRNPLAGRYGLPPRQRSGRGGLLCLYDDTGSRLRMPPLNSSMSADDLDQSYRVFAAADLFFRLLSEGLKPDWLDPICGSNSDLPLGWSIDRAAKKVLERFAQCDTKAIVGKRLRVMTAIRTLTTETGTSFNNVLLFPYDLCEPGGKQ